MHVGNKHDNYRNIELCIIGWSLKSVENIDTGEKEWEDIHDDDKKEISTTNSEKYLGHARKNARMEFHFEIAIIL